MKNSLLLNYYF
jgi:hypothetical protein